MIYKVLVTGPGIINGASLKQMRISTLAQNVNLSPLPNWKREFPLSLKSEEKM